jgi:pantoate--beta-alanine ligase
MLLIKGIKDLKKQLKIYRHQKRAIGFVPTMGALHAGHISLLKRSKKTCDITVCSIFVNPTQFNDKTDFNRYPNTIGKDIEILNDTGCDILFLPSVKEMYPEGFVNKTTINFGFLAETLEGEHRPGHFSGMAQIVEKLLRIVNPNKLFMGQKDYQQQLIVRELIKTRNFKTELVTCPTTREKDGLAMSSRNARLDAASRKLAVQISKTLRKVKSEIRNPKSEIPIILKDGFERLASFKEITPEYIEIRNAETLLPPTNKSEKLIALAAVKIGGVRLIDNLLLN